MVLTDIVKCEVVNETAEITFEDGNKLSFGSYERVNRGLYFCNSVITLAEEKSDKIKVAVISTETDRPKFHSIDGQITQEMLSKYIISALKIIDKTKNKLNDIVYCTIGDMESWLEMPLVKYLQGASLIVLI